MVGDPLDRPAGTLRDYRQNQIVKKVSSWAAIIAVPALITGYYGMNVPFPGYAHEWGVIAATALTHGLAVVTRNRRDFANADVEVIDPFA